MALPRQFERGVDQEHPEQVEHPTEGVDRGGADGDESCPHDQRHHDADQQFLLVHPGTANEAIITVNTNRLSTDNAFSVTYRRSIHRRTGHPTATR